MWGGARLRTLVSKILAACAPLSQPDSLRACAKRANASVELRRRREARQGSVRPLSQPRWSAAPCIQASSRPPRVISSIEEHVAQDGWTEVADAAGPGASCPSGSLQQSAAE